MEDVEEQLAIYNRLYYHKRNEDDASMQKYRESAQRDNHRKKIQEYEEANNTKLKPDEINDDLLSELMNAKKPLKAKRGTPKYDMSNFKIIMPIPE